MTHRTTKLRKMVPGLLPALLTGLYLLVLSLIVTDVLGWLLSGLTLLLAGVLRSVFRFARGQLEDDSLPGAVKDMVVCSVGLMYQGGRKSWTLGERLYVHVAK